MNAPNYVKDMFIVKEGQISTYYLSYAVQIGPNQFTPGLLIAGDRRAKLPIYVLGKDIFYKRSEALHYLTTREHEIALIQAERLGKTQSGIASLLRQAEQEEKHGR